MAKALVTSYSGQFGGAFRVQVRAAVDLVDGQSGSLISTSVIVDVDPVLDTAVSLRNKIVNAVVAIAPSFDSGFQISPADVVFPMSSLLSGIAVSL